MTLTVPLVPCSEVVSRDPLRQLTMTLAWAVRHDVPFVDALWVLLGRHHHRRRDCDWWFLGGGLPIINHGLVKMSTGDQGFRKAVRRTIRRLRDGRPLAQALAEGMPGLPDYYLTAIADAEVAGTLETVLPVLAAQLDYSINSRTLVQSLLVQLASYVGVTIMIGSGLMIFIIPKFAKIFDEIAQKPLPSVTIWLMTVSDFFLQNLFGLVVIGTVAAVITPILLRTRFADLIVMPVPVVGRFYRRLRALELAQSMSVCLQTGKDVGAAAAWSRRACRSLWLRRRLAVFLDCVERGVPWSQAWADAKLGPPFEQWLIANSAAREQPQAGFRAIADHHEAALVRAFRRLEQFGPVACTLATAVVIAPIVFSIFAALTSLIDHMAM